MQILRPLDLQMVRLSLRDGMTLRSMGELIPVYVRSCPYAVITENRIQDWELGRRSVPEYVYQAYAAIVVDDWASDRHEAGPGDYMELDHRYGTMLSPAFGLLLMMEHKFQQSNDTNLLTMLPELAMQRQAWKQQIKDVLGVDMEHVWAERLEDIFT